VFAKGERNRNEAKKKKYVQFSFRLYLRKVLADYNLMALFQKTVLQSNVNGRAKTIRLKCFTNRKLGGKTWKKGSPENISRYNKTSIDGWMAYC